MTPRLRLLGLTAVCGVPLLGSVWLPALGLLGVVLTVGLAVAALLDLLLTPPLAQVEVAREVRDVLSVGARNPVTVWLRSRARRPLMLVLHDEPPQPCAMFELPFVAELPPGVRAARTYWIEPFHRGDNAFGPLHLRAVSRWGLWLLSDVREIPKAVRIYPDIQAVRQVELLARQNRLAEAGVRLSRLRGRGSEFDRLREYRREDEYRGIDWKATARHQSLISREYVVERNQNLLLVLDSGRSMCNSQDGVTHFDRALNAAILLSYVALRQGDTVGLLAGANQIQRWVRPLRGMGAIESLIRQVYDLQATYEATDYELLTEELRRRYRKRSLVIVLTHALDELHFETIAGQLRRLRSPHLVLGAFLENVPLRERAEMVPETDLEAFQVAAATEMIAAQQAQIARLQQSGLLVVNTQPEQLSSRLISRYLDIKARHQL